MKYWGCQWGQRSDATPESLLDVDWYTLYEEDTDREVVIKANRPKSTTVYRSNRQAHPCKPVSWGSHLSNSSSLQAGWSFSRPPLLRVPPTCQSTEKDVSRRKGCPRTTSWRLHSVPSSLQLDRFLPCCDSCEPCYLCFLWTWWNIVTRTGSNPIHTQWSTTSGTIT